MKIKQYDHVILKNGRTATIVEILEKDVAYLADVDLPGPDWDTIEIKYRDILGTLSDEQYKALTMSSK